MLSPGCKFHDPHMSDQSSQNIQIVSSEVGSHNLGQLPVVDIWYCNTKSTASDILCHHHFLSPCPRPLLISLPLQLQRVHIHVQDGISIKGLWWAKKNNNFVMGLYFMSVALCSEHQIWMFWDEKSETRSNDGTCCLHNSQIQCRAILPIFNPPRTYALENSYNTQDLCTVGRGNPIQMEWSSRFHELFSKPQKPSRGRVWALNGHLWTSRLLQWNQNKKKRETDNQFPLILSFSTAMPQFCCSNIDWIEDPGIPQTLLGRVRKNWLSVSQETISWF